MSPTKIAPSTMKSPENAWPIVCRKLISPMKSSEGTRGEQSEQSGGRNVVSSGTAQRTTAT